MLFGDKSAQIEKLAQKKNSAKLVAMIQDKKPEIRLQAIKALGTVGDDTAINALINLFTAPDTDTKIAAIKSAGGSGRQVIKSHLQYMIQTETNENVKAAIHEALAKIPNKN